MDVAPEPAGDEDLTDEPEATAPAEAVAPEPDATPADGEEQEPTPVVPPVEPERR